MRAARFVLDSQAAYHVFDPFQVIVHDEPSYTCAVT